MCVHLLLISSSIAGVPASRALPGFPMTAPPPVCVPAVSGALAVWRQRRKKNTQAWIDNAIQPVNLSQTDKQTNISSVVK